MIPMTDLSPKGRQTRQHIYDTAIKLFREQGYDEATMRDIAREADVSIGLTYRYFARKEDIVMAFYCDRVTELVAYMDTLPEGQMADRYNAVLEEMTRQLNPYRYALMALFGVAMRPDSDISLMGTDNNPISKQLSDGYYQLVVGSEDALRSPKAEQMGVVLYTVHMLILLFWLYDRSDNQASTHKLLHFVHDLFKTVRPMFFLPIFPQAIAKLSSIVMPNLPVTEKEVSSNGNGASKH